MKKTRVSVIILSVLILITLSVAMRDYSLKINTGDQIPELFMDGGIDTTLNSINVSNESQQQVEPVNVGSNLVIEHDRDFRFRQNASVYADNNIGSGRLENGDVNISRFNKYASCPFSTTQPSIVGDFIHLPVAQDVPSGCLLNYIDATSLDKFALTEFSADMIINANSAAPNSTEEMAFFAASDNVTWVGGEFGFVITNTDNTIKGYVQDKFNGKKPDYRVLGTSDGKLHNYKASFTPDGLNNFIFSWYIDGVLNKTLTYENPTANYTNLNYTIVGTTHRKLNWSANGAYLAFGHVRYTGISR